MAKFNLLFLTVVLSWVMFLTLTINGSFSQPRLQHISVLADTPKSYVNSKSLLLNNKHHLVIEGLEIKNAKINCIELVNCSNIIIRNCRLLHSKGNGVQIASCNNITVEQCYMEDIATGVLAVDSYHIQVNKNKIKNVQGPLPRGQMVQFDDVTGGGNRVTNNRSDNLPGQSAPEDAINMFKSSGTFNDPIQICGNIICGGGPSKTGGGIALGDNGGAYMVVEHNILVNPGQYGIGIASGTHIQILNNLVYSKQQPFTNVGIAVWNQSNTACAMNTIRGNKVKWTNSNGETNGGWNNGNCGKVEGWDENEWDANITDAIITGDFLNSK